MVDLAKLAPRLRGRLIRREGPIQPQSLVPHFSATNQSLSLTSLNTLDEPPPVRNNPLLCYTSVHQTLADSPPVFNSLWLLCLLVLSAQTALFSTLHSTSHAVATCFGSVLQPNLVPYTWPLVVEATESSHPPAYLSFRISPQCDTLPVVNTTIDAVHCPSVLSDLRAAYTAVTLVARNITLPLRTVTTTVREFQYIPNSDTATKLSPIFVKIVVTFFKATVQLVSKSICIYPMPGRTPAAVKGFDISVYESKKSYYIDDSEPVLRPAGKRFFVPPPLKPIPTPPDTPAYNPSFPTSAGLDIVLSRLIRLHIRHSALGAVAKGMFAVRLSWA